MNIRQSERRLGTSDKDQKLKRKMFPEVRKSSERSGVALCWTFERMQLSYTYSL